MRKIFVAVMAAVASLAAVIATATPANAYIDDPMISGYKFYTGQGLCVEAPNVNGSYYRVAYIAQTYNNLIGTDVVAMNYRDNCATAGYPPSRSMGIGLFTNPDYPYCFYHTNQQTATYNGFQRWTNRPWTYINTAFSNCVSGQNRRDHSVSWAIGRHLGLVGLGSAGWNSHVMNQTQWSIDNVPLPIAQEGQKLREVYLGVFCDSGTVC